MCRVELIDPLTVRADVEQWLLEWRSLIQDRKTHALRLLKQLIVGRLELIPNMEERYYGFGVPARRCRSSLESYHRA